MIIEQQRDLGRQSLKISAEIKSNGINGDFREQMLIHNSVEGILPFEILREDQNKVYEYPIGGLETIKSFCTHHRPVRKELVQILDGILKTVYHGREFMLHENDYVLTPESVFLDSDMKVQIAYFSGYEALLRDQLRDFAEFLMDNVEYSDEGAVLLVYAIYMKTRSESCSLEDLFGIINSEQQSESGTGIGSEERNEALCTQNVISEKASSGIVEDAAFREIIPDIPDDRITLSEVLRSSPGRLRLISVLVPVAVLLIEICIMKSASMINFRTGKPDVIKTFLCLFGGLAVMVFTERLMWGSFIAKMKKSLASARERQEEATIMLSDDGTAEYPFSLVSETYPAIYISRFPCIIGKDGSNPQVDRVIDCVGVSRIHFKIDKTETGFTITDLNSTNGTFCNDKKLVPYVAANCRRGDKISVGKSCIYYCN